MRRCLLLKPRNCEPCGKLISHNGANITPYDNIIVICCLNRLPARFWDPYRVSEFGENGSVVWIPYFAAEYMEQYARKGIIGRLSRNTRIR